MVAVILATALALQVQVQAGVQRDSAGTTVGVRVGLGATAADSNLRIPVTAAHLATAFHDAGARSMLAGARAARFQQDSALLTYDAKVFQRISVGISLRATGRERLMIRDEGVARVRWDARAGAVVDMLGKRTTIPMDDTPDQTLGEDTRNNLSLPIPYFPGRETLWMGSSIAQMSVDEESFVHPLARGAEAYYKYSSGDSLEFTLPDSRTIHLRELRIEAREPRWNVIVGSFWFDQASHQLVRAIYRPSIEMDIWSIAAEDAKRDSTGDDDVPFWVRGLISPLKATIQVFNVEYSLFEGRFWLPVAQGAEGKVQASLIRVPGTFEERYVYESVNRPLDVVPLMAAAPPAPRMFLTRPLRDSLTRAGVRGPKADSIVNARFREFNDSLPRSIRARQTRDSLKAAGLTPKGVDSVMSARFRANTDSILAQRKLACAAAPDSLISRHFRRYDQTVDVLLRTPCDLEKLKHSPDLPASPYDPGEEVFGTKDRDVLLKALDFGLQAGWGPQKIVVDWGFGQSRYNRVEGFSTGVLLKQEVGMGYAWTAQLRGSQGDKQINGELGASRGNGRVSLALNAYRRLVSAGDWGEPLTFSASLPALLYARDEGFYYRSWGAELLRTSERHGLVTWRAFVEAESRAPVTTRFSLFGGSHDDRFLANTDATEGTYSGASVRWQQNWGLAPKKWKAIADVRLEGASGAGGATDYGRGAFDLTVTHGLFGDLILGVTGAAGSSVGELPAQRNWFVGGTRTVRGQNADAGVGNAFWFTRVDLLAANRSFPNTIFADFGWAGPRTSDWGRSERLLSGVGVGSTFFEGLMRLDIARGLWPKQRWRVDFSLEARF